MATGPAYIQTVEVALGGGIDFKCSSFDCMGLCVLTKTDEFFCS